MIRNLIKFYQECYEADTRTFSLSNVFSAKVENKLIIEGEDELLNGHLPKIPLNSAYATAVLENLQAYQKEKSLYVFSFFAMGKTTGSTRTSNICAPLFFYPAEIQEENGFYYLVINKELVFPNISFLESYRTENSLELTDLFDQILNDDFNFEKCGLLKKILESEFNQFNSEPILTYPHCLGEKALKSIHKKRFDGIRVVSAIGLGVIKHSSSTLGIMSELKELQEFTDYSPPLESLFQNSTSLSSIRNSAVSYVPVIPSIPQKQAIQSVNDHQETLIIGPPGTGKSFTIAALTIDQINQGKSVLIVSKTDQAVDVVKSKIEGDIGIKGIAIRGGRKQYLKELKLAVKNILCGLPASYSLKGEEAQALKQVIDKEKKHLYQLEKQLFDQINDDLRWGEYIFNKKNSKSIFTKIRKKYIEWLNSAQVPHWDLIIDYYNTKRSLIKNLKDYVNANFQYQLRGTLKNNRSTLTKFSKAIRARTLAKQEELFASIDFDVIFKALPIWLCNLNDLFEVLPFNKKLFDFVIIDEASQCDIATSLPAIQRAKKVIIVGDPMQLRHYSFLSRGFMSLTRTKHGLDNKFNDSLFDYRDKSILDIYFDKIENQNQVIFLDEHFRGNKSLINFSNREFYASKLKVIKSLPHMGNNSIAVIETKGTRDKTGGNKLEIKAIIKKLLLIIEVEKDFSNKLSSSIGVLSPFRTQSEYLFNEIQSCISQGDIDRHSIKVGTPYSFQGDERDIILISWAIDDSTSRSAINYLNKSEVFNVTISRAKNELILFTSFDKKQLPANSLLVKYINSVQSSETLENSEEKKIHDEFISEVREIFKDEKTKIYSDYTIAGIPIDILLENENGYYGIDLIGYPGNFFEANTMGEYEILGRAGVKMLPLPYSNWYFDRQSCVDGIRKILSG